MKRTRQVDLSVVLCNSALNIVLSKCPFYKTSVSTECDFIFQLNSFRPNVHSTKSPFDQTYFRLNVIGLNVIRPNVISVFLFINEILIGFLYIVRITYGTMSLVVCTVYLPPNTEPALYQQHAASVNQLCKLLGTQDEIVVLGDYNLPYLRWRFDDDIGAFLPINASSEQETSLVEDIVATCFQSYIGRLESNMKDDPKRFWSYLRSRTTSRGFPQLIKYNGKTATTPDDAVKLFSSFVYFIFIYVYCVLFILSLFTRFLA